MLFTIISTVVAFSVVATLLSPNAPAWLQWVSWTYILIWVAIGLFAINADKIGKWADRKESELRSKLNK
ncbi:hypothetical protein [Enterovibrio coralii]|uniref:Uncharacterized protein n=1 Tax=Enterovibrio coralii TaxID=294935 RepID=A0A135I822_9GAMM|nr:hypothetical protein [Enterovibrio coralii]KXF81599.1 hypothetical protein ATN88_02675 [Enterovibrio coralii]